MIVALLQASFSRPVGVGVGVGDGGSVLVAVELGEFVFVGGGVGIGVLVVLAVGGGAKAKWKETESSETLPPFWASANSCTKPQQCSKKGTVAVLIVPFERCKPLLS